jgi:transposase
MDRQILRDWVHRYREEGIAGLSNRPLPGRLPKLTEGQMAAPAKQSASGSPK